MVRCQWLNGVSLKATSWTADLPMMLVMVPGKAVESHDFGQYSHLNLLVYLPAAVVSLHGSRERASSRCRISVP
jgi:hypothetical protein